MLVYVVILCDFYQDHFLGVYSSRAAAEKYIQSQDKQEDEHFFISEEFVHS
jgi:hypothetical protein